MYYLLYVPKCGYDRLGQPPRCNIFFHTLSGFAPSDSVHRVVSLDTLLSLLTGEVSHGESQLPRDTDSDATETVLCTAFPPAALSGPRGGYTTLLFR